MIVNPELSPECLIEQAGRVCYKSDLVSCYECGGDGAIDGETCKTCEGRGYVERDYIADPDPESAQMFVGRIMKRGHESVIEHASATVKLVCCRGVTHELVRHRIASYSQESSRFCNYSKDKFGKEITVIEPPFPSTPEGQSQRIFWARAMEEAENKYFAMLNAGAPPEIAREVLPNALKTEIVTTFNAREWLHFFALRMSKAAHPQIRQIAYLAFLLLQPHFPTVLAARKELANAVLTDLHNLTGHRPDIISARRELVPGVHDAAPHLSWSWKDVQPCGG